MHIYNNSRRKSDDRKNIIWEIQFVPKLSNYETIK